MRVALVRPPFVWPKGRPNSTMKVPLPLGLAYIAATLRGAGHEVSCIDSTGLALGQSRESLLDPKLLEQGLSLPEIVARIPETAQVIGITSMFSCEWLYVMALIRGIRARFPTQFIVLGGEHVTADHAYILKTMPEVDACVLGEGEYKMLALVDALEHGVPRREVPGVAVFDPETRSVRKNPEKDGHYRIQDVNAIPRPAWDLLPLKAYLDLNQHGIRGLRTMPMLASRGCPHRCTFCSSPQMWTTRWKARDVDDLIEEIKGYVRDHGINQLEFYDLTIFIDMKWIKEFCQRLIDENLGLSWIMSAGARTEALSPDVLDLVKRSGCTKLAYPFETGGERTNALIKKKINYKRSLGSMKNAIKVGIFVKATVILGFPFQTWRDVVTEFAFAIRLAWIGAHDIAFFNFVPYPGSELHEQLVAEGRIVKDETYPAWLSRTFLANYSDSQSWCPGISAKSLLFLCIIGSALFYSFQFLFRPQRAFALAFRVWSGRPDTVLETWLTKLARHFLGRRLLGEEHGSAA